MYLAINKYDFQLKIKYNVERGVYIMKTFGERFKSKRIENNLTQEELASDFNKKYHYSFNKSSISQYENNNRLPEINALKDFAEYFNVSVDWLLAIEEKPLFSNLKEPAASYVKSSLAVPVLKYIPTGKNLITADNIEDYISVDEREAAGGMHFYIRAQDNEMCNLRIIKDDLLYVKKQAKVGNGDIAIVMINEHTFLKQVFFEKNSIVLQSASPNTNPMIFSNNDIKIGRLKIIGKVLHVKFTPCTNKSS